MATFNKFHVFVENVAEGVHILSTDTLKFYLTNAVPSASGDAVKADLAEIAAGFGYTAGGEAAAQTGSAQSGGTYQLTLADPALITAAGGSIGPFQYAVLYNDTPAGDPLIGWFDYGSAITLAAGESLQIDCSAGTGVLTIT